MFEGISKSEIKLLESGLPVDILSRDAAIEMSFKPRPSYYARCKELDIAAPKNSMIRKFEIYIPG
ncbi:MAG: hypothetical protein QXR41_01315 [Nitrososphaerota archaeon]